MYTFLASNVQLIRFPSFQQVLIWTAKLKSRLNEQTKYLDSQRIKMFESDYGRYVMERYKKITEKIEHWEDKQVSKQVSKLVDDYGIIMSDYLLRRSRSGKLEINVRPEMDLLFQAINRMTLNKIPIKEEVLNEFWSRRDELWHLKMKLLRITEWYNFTRFEVREQEKHLIRPNTDEINAIVEGFISAHTWKSYSTEALDELFDTLRNLFSRLVKAHDNIDKILAKMRCWGDIPLFVRKSEDNEHLLCIENRDDIVDARYKQCIETQEFIENVMRENFCLFQNTLVEMTADNEVAIDKAALDNYQKTEEDCKIYALYERYVDEIIGNEILVAAKNSLKYLYDELRVPSPLFEVCFSLDIENRTSIFHPDLAVDAKEGFVSFVASLMVDIIGMGGLIKRVKANLEPNEPPSFIDMLRENDTIENYRLDILVKSKVVSKHTVVNFEQYQMYAPLWKIDRTKYLDAFLKYGRELNEEDIMKINEGTFDGEPTKPTLEAIEHEIKRHHDLIPGIEAIPEFIDTEPWFRIKMHLFKAKLVHETMEWVNLFMSYLSDHVTSRLNELEVFILDANIVLSAKCEKSELQKFRQIYDLVNEINRQAAEVDYMFPPLKAEMMLLRKYDQEMDEKVRTQFVELPLWWEKLKKLSKTVSKDVEPVKEHQMGLTLKRLKLFTLRIHDFQQRFQNQAIFKSDCKNAYEIIDKMLDHIIKYEKQAAMLDIFAALFNINVGPNHDLMAQCRKETKVLKQVWDYWYSMQHHIYRWENMLWSKIDVEAVESECKRIAKEVRALDACCKQWEPYVVLDDELLNLMTSLR